jgi:5'-methylthioadenosine phosphorylase
MPVDHSNDERAEIGVIGGSGFYELLDDARESGSARSTPFGEPSEPPLVGLVGGRAVAFIPRHGRDHRYPPHLINYRANLWALRALGVQQILAPCAVGSLQPEILPGSVVIPSQLVDRTTGRTQTFFEQGACHVPFADPYCPVGRAVVLRSATELGLHPVDGGTTVVVEGPRFSTRAESRWFAGLGWSVVNMTGHPEAVLARELAMCYTTIALVTDLDAGVAEGGGVTQRQVFRSFAEHLAELRDLVMAAIAATPAERTCPCPGALDGLAVPFLLPG